MPCKKQVIGEVIGHLLFQHVWAHIGFPTSIVSDWDFIFLGKFWSYLWELVDTKIQKSTNFHPWIDWQIEVVNMIVIHLLQGYCNKHPNIWDEQLYYVQHAYNWAMHSYTQSSPFETCFCYLPKSPLDFIFGKYLVAYGCKYVAKYKRFI